MGHAFATGHVLRGKYRLEQVLGRGGMGVVHLATHLVLGQHVAIKIVKATAEDRDRDYLAKRFLREARAAALLGSEHVVRILDVDEADDGTPFMVMEYLQGEDLGAILRKSGRLSIPEAVRYVLEACEALAEAHARGIVHRDLKPSNLFRAVTPRNEHVIKLLDFGISKLDAPGEDLSLTDTNAIVGSPIFMSPEQLLASRDVDHRTDIWSLGVTLYQLLSGTLPFEASSASAMGARIASQAPRPLSSVLPEAPADLEAAITKCLARAPEDRFPDVVSFARALAPFTTSYDQRQTSKAAAVEQAAIRGGSARVVPVAEASPPEPPPPEASGERWTRSQLGPDPGATGERRKEQALPPPTAETKAESPEARRPERSIPRRFGVLGAAIAIVIAVAVVIVVVRFSRGADRAPPVPVPSIASTASTPPPPPSTAAEQPSASAPAPPATSAVRVPTAKPVPRPRSSRPSWSKDPSELDLK